MANSRATYNEDYDDYLDLNLRLVYMVDDFYELMLIALLSPDKSQNGSVSASEE